MKALSIKKIITITSIFLIMICSSPAVAQGTPGDDDGGQNVNDQVPIDENIWLGLIGGCLISVYFISKNHKKTLVK